MDTLDHYLNHQLSFNDYDVTFFFQSLSPPPHPIKMLDHFCTLLLDPPLYATKQNLYGYSDNSSPNLTYLSIYTFPQKSVPTPYIVR